MDSPVDQIHLIIIGGGIAGLSSAISTCIAGHRCTILEQAQDFKEVGAGVQLTPNGTRILAQWGLLEKLAPCAAAPESLTILRYDGSRILSHESGWQKKMTSAYNAPFWNVHRADLQSAMLQKARELGVKICTGARVQDIDFDCAYVVLADTKEVVRGDAILAADGLWSQARSLILQKPAAPILTGDLAYRITLRLEELTQCPELIEWVSNPRVTFWIGPDAHAVGYSLRAGKEFNLVLLCPDNLPELCNRTSGDLSEMVERFKDWDSTLLKFLSCVKRVDKWRLMHYPCLENWNGKHGFLTMAGDSCHPMLPYLAQGANSAMEDGAVLGRLLGSARSAEDIPLVLETYQKLRRERVREISEHSLNQRTSFHLPDGPLQEARDKALAEGESVAGDFPSRWTCPIVQPWLYGYDATAEAEKAIHGIRLLGQM
ncbi:FAD binding domain-containing protein [Stachybotrys elegans]|uniref:FAD binding domain-containing protein n=1 Tax=Stachybotrys elegans TaxID=80388 RepID=A0A8K0T253_9HYPO|nr:FAD binding domain-containing protein [Stachybotrys elegans]